MSDTYTVKGVTVTPLGGGFYELKHASIEGEGNIEKVRGKEAADKRADEIGTTAAAATQQQEEGHIEQQPSLDDLTQANEQAAKDAEEAAAKLQAAEDKNAALEARLNKTDELLQKLLAAAEKGADVVTSVKAEEGPVEGRVPGGIPTSFTGELTKEQKAALKKAGLGYTRIILEENSDIPPTGLFVGHNGRGYQIQPGVEVDVPDFVLGVLKDAKMAAPVTDSKSMKVLGYRERMKYPYRVVD